MRIGVNITKSTLFRGKTQEFHNTYYYNLPTAVTAPSETIVDEIVATEKALHSSDVQFLRAQVWSAGGTAAQNAMLFQKNLAGTGSSQANASQDRERTVLIRWPAGFDSRGKPVYLRKYYHTCGAAAGILLTPASIQGNTGQIASGDRNTIATKADECREVGALENWQLCAKSGRLHQSPAQCHPYLEHHQLGEMWR